MWILRISTCKRKPLDANGLDCNILDPGHLLPPLSPNLMCNQVSMRFGMVGKLPSLLYRPTNDQTEDANTATGWMILTRQLNHLQTHKPEWCRLSYIARGATAALQRRSTIQLLRSFGAAMHDNFKPTFGILRPQKGMVQVLGVEQSSQQQPTDFTPTPLTRCCSGELEWHGNQYSSALWLTAPRGRAIRESKRLATMLRRKRETTCHVEHWTPE